jgi:hypothetical protein
MKKLDFNLLIILTLVSVIFLFVWQAIAGQKLYMMTGKIVAIDQRFNTVVIEVPLGEKMFTVGGPLSSGSTLRKDGQPAGLTDFSVGDQVRVKWRATDGGHLIEMMQSF